MQNPLMWLVEAINALNVNFWAASLVGSGVYLSVHGQSDLGMPLMSAGLIVFKSDFSSALANSQGPKNPTP